MPKILHTARYTGMPWEILQSVVPVGFTIETLSELSYESLLEESSDADYFLVSGRLPIDARVLSAARNLKMIQRTGVGTDMLDLDAIANKGIPVYVNSGVNSQSVAEHTVTLILACLKRLTIVNAQVHSGIWKKQINGVQGHELFGKKVGLVGMGNIGRKVASMLNAFGAKVLYSDVFRQSDEIEKQLSLTYFPTFESMLPEIDVLSFHCPLTDSNVNMLNRETLAMLSPGAVIVNTARGKLIDPVSLYDSVVSGHVASVGLDVHYEEPLGGDSLLASLENVILTPHIGGITYESFKSMLQKAVYNIVAFDSGKFDDILGIRLV